MHQTNPLNHGRVETNGALKIAVTLSCKVEDLFKLPKN